MIKTDKEMLKARKKSKMALGRGTMMMARMQTMKKTIVRLFTLMMGEMSGPKNGKTRLRILFFLAIIFDDVR